MDFCILKCMWWTQRSVFPSCQQELAIIIQKMSLESIFISLDQVAFLDLCKCLTGYPIFINYFSPWPFNTVTKIIFQENLSKIPLLTGQTQMSLEDTFKAFYNLSLTSLIKFLSNSSAHLCVIHSCHTGQFTCLFPTVFPLPGRLTFCAQT